MHLAKTLGLFFPMMTVFTNTGLAIVIWLGGRQAILGQITTGDFVAFTTYLNLLTWPMMAMGWVTNLLQRGSASMRRINRVLRESPEITEPTAAVAVSRIQGNIEFRNLAFRYPGQADKALKDIRVSIGAGETVALVGRVGAGKSTLLQTIPRLWDAPAGTLLLDGRDVRGLRLTVLRENIGFVPQEVFLFSDSIRQNVVFGRAGVSDKDLETILRICGIWNEIMQLEKGLDTVLGERGITLSGGQRQRLTIARALLRDPAVLILDDALSMVDTRTEEHILNEILNMRRTATNLIVSHRVSTISRADRILVLEQGKLVENGTHAELLRAGGIYANLYEKQLLAEELEENTA
jgi:ATP-binding cassette subfamily B protein